MIKLKTKEQRKQDVERILESSKKCGEACLEFAEDLLNSEYQIKWMRFGVISDLLDTSDLYRGAIDASKHTHTYTSYKEDHENQLYDKAVDVKRYE